MWDIGTLINVKKENNTYEIEISKKNQLETIVQISHNSLKLRLSCCKENLKCNDKPNVF